MMNGYHENGYHEKREMDEDAFGAKGNIVSAFDAFRKQPAGNLRSRHHAARH